MFNMETLGILFVLYLFKIFVIWCLFVYNKCSKNGKYKKYTMEYHRLWLD